MTEPPDLTPGGAERPGLSRRSALKLFASGAATLAAGCRQQVQMLPYRDMPEGGPAGETEYFATALPLAGAARGVLVESYQGRPIKVHGNPDHPASLGGTDVFAEAELLALFDPSRSTSPVAGEVPVGWSEVAERLRAAGADAGTAILTGPVGSPTMARQIADLRRQTPGLRWFAHHPAPPAMEVPSGAGPGERMQLWPDFSALDLLVTIGADPLGPGPGQAALARGWSQARRARRGSFRVHAFEAVPSQTGSKADFRTALPPSELPKVAAALRAARDGATPENTGVARAARALDAAEGRALVVGGPDLPIQAHRAIDEINAMLRAPVSRLVPYWRWPDLSPEHAPALIEALRAGEIERLVVLCANPAYDLGPGFAEAANGTEIYHFGLRQDETATLATLHGPLHHPLEDWSDLRGVEGSAALVQPLIAPLHETRSAHQVLAMLRGRFGEEPLDLVQETWRAAWGETFEETWHECLQTGVIADFPVGTVTPDWSGPDGDAQTQPGEGAFELVKQLSPAVHAGEYAPNGWLQECPAPFTKQVWGNAASFAAADAERLGIEDGEAVEIGDGARSVILPAVILPGQAEGTIGTTLGYGRLQAGQIGTGVGEAVGPLGARVTAERRGGKGLLVQTQLEFDQHERDILKSVSADAPELPEKEHASFYAGWDYESPSWGMVIDTDVCIGCNACMIACQSENNIPVVGPEEVARGRRMHWIRIDTYDTGDGGRGFQPVPCMQCEEAPCEPACPVEASVHDNQGLNAQVYNRCIGTRFCQANCPYQVRRFNFFDYSDSQAYADLGADLLQALHNPDVSVRGRGVMEKCTYCVQRIEAARHEASRSDRPIEDGEVVTACQSACPAQAITFGDIADPESAVNAAKQDPRHYALLEHLGTRPRTTYLARVTPAESEDGA